MKLPVSRKLHSFSLLFLLCVCVAARVSRTIDEIIAGSSKDETDFDFMGDISGSMVRVELDMMMTVEQYQQLYATSSLSRSLKSPRIPRPKRKAIRPLTYRWTNKEIPYRIDSEVFSRDDYAEIMKAIEEWQNYTCITFRAATSSDSNYVLFEDGTGCSSYIGMNGGKHPVVLAGGCRYKGVIAHEIGHAVGFYHEQNRPDRDDHIVIYKENIIHPSLENNFQKYPLSAVDTYGVPYDYRSIMHYGSRAFSGNGQHTIKTKDPNFQDVIGNREGLSFYDIKLANLMYSCGQRCNPNIRCPGEGFVGKDCQCWCPGNPVQRCQSTGIVTTTTKRPTVATTQKPTSATCEDMNPYCSGWAEYGYCKTNNYVKTYCKKSCHLCQGTGTSERMCEDVRKHCEFWKKQGYCTGGIYATFMAEKCPVTCGACSVSTGEHNHGNLAKGESDAINVLYSSLLIITAASLSSLLILL